MTERVSMHLIKDHILREVRGKTVLVPLSDKETDFNGMLVLNHTAAYICRLLKKDMDEKQIVEMLSVEYEMKPEAVEGDVRRFLKELEDCHVLVR